jgi:hypothetical protein
LRPLIFLDIDGVLARLVEGYRYGTLDGECVDALNMLLDRTNASVVISSSWRYVDKFSALIARLEGQGVRAGRIISKTPIPERQEMGVILSPCRGDEIGAWLDAYKQPLRPIVILDDEGDMGAFKDRLVRTNPEHGLTLADVERACALLGEQG